MVIFEIRNTKRDESVPSTFAQILANFASQPSYSFFKKWIFGKKTASLFLEIVVLRQTIHFFIVCDDHLASYFSSQLSAHYPTLRITKVTDYLPSFAKARFIETGQIQLQQPYYYPLNTYKMFRDHDPMSSFLGILSRLSDSEAAIIQLVLLPAGGRWQKGANSMIEKGITDTEGRRRPLSNEHSIKEKIISSGLKTGIRMLVASTDSLHVKSILTDLAGAFGVLSRGDGNSLHLKKPNTLFKSDLIKAIIHRKPLMIPKFHYLNIDEIATIFHPPSKELASIKNIAWGGQLASQAPENLPIAPEEDSKESDVIKKQINFFARTEYKNALKTFGIKREDRRKHTYIIGKTGTGKTTLIANMAINDIRNGEGLAVIDPHGDLCNIILDYVPKKRINDIAYLDPSDTNFPFHLNPLELPEGATKAQGELVASGIVSIFYKLYHYSWGPRMEYILRNALMTLTNVPNATLIEVPRILSEKSYRQKVLEKLDDPVLQTFWHDEYEQMSEKLRTEAIAPIQNKIGQFVTSPMIRNIIGSPHSTVDLATMMDEGKIVIINLSQGKLGEDNAALLGAMFITKMQLAAMHRVYQKEEERRDFYLYVDEFQNFATQSFLKILSEARKYRLNLTLANQYVGQIDEEVKKAIFGNVGTLITFLVGAEDARGLSFEFGNEYKPEDFVSLGNYQILLKMAIEGHTSMPFYATTLPLPRSKTESHDKVIRISRERYSKKVE
jgi:hypothetical protein